MTIHKEGYRILLTTIIALLVFNLALRPFIMSIPALQIFFGVLSFVLFLIVLQFFRSPKRTITIGERSIIAPADGKVVVIEEVQEDEYYKDKRIQVSIFMSPVNVHVNWAPMKGITKLMKYHPGKFLVAWHPKSSTENERTTMVFENDHFSVLMRQIAGALARRIVFYPEEGQRFNQGDQVGFIKFGSRIDLMLPLNADIKVNLDQKVTGQQTVIAEIPA